MVVEHRDEGGGEAGIGAGDDGGGDAAAGAGAFGGGHFGLAHGAQFLGAVRAQGGVAFDEDGGGYVVAAEVGQQVLGQIAVVGLVPEVVVGVEDGQGGVER